MMKQRFHPDDLRIFSIILQLTTVFSAIIIIPLIGLYLLWDGRIDEFINWISGGWRSPM